MKYKIDDPYLIKYIKSFNLPKKITYLKKYDEVIAHYNNLIPLRRSIHRRNQNCTFDYKYMLENIRDENEKEYFKKYEHRYIQQFICNTCGKYFENGSFYPHLFNDCK